jgi:hypothetical protein
MDVEKEVDSSLPKRIVAFGDASPESLKENLERVRRSRARRIHSKPRSHAVDQEVSYDYLRTTTSDSREQNPGRRGASSAITLANTLSLLMNL